MILLAQDELVTRHGSFTESLFYDGQNECVSLTLGDLRDGEEILCRIHSSCLSAHAFGSIGCDCWEQMDSAQQMIAALGYGIIIWLPQEGRGNGHLAKILAEQGKRRGLLQGEAYVSAGFPEDNRDYSAAVSVISFFGIRSVVLLSANLMKREQLQASGVHVSRQLFSWGDAR